LSSGETLRVWDDDAVLLPVHVRQTPRSPIAISILGGFKMDDDSSLKFVLEADPWDSLISFEPGIPVQLGGALELTFADDVDVATQVGRTLHIFDWTGVSPTGKFQVTAPLAWDLSNLYTTGEVRLIGIPGDFNSDSQLSAADIDGLAGAIRSANPDVIFDLTGDNIVNLADHAYWVHSARHTSLGDANLDGEFNSGDLATVLAASQYEDDIANNSNWASGDWDGDGDFTTRDLVAALADGGYERGPKPAAAAALVPESCGALFFASAMLGLARVHHKRRAKLCSSRHANP
jgi:hypothetical protein